jgi:hypothetical protein
MGDPVHAGQQQRMRRPQTASLRPQRRDGHGRRRQLGEGEALGEQRGVAQPPMHIQGMSQPAMTGFVIPITDSFCYLRAFIMKL